MSTLPSKFFPCISPSRRRNAAGTIFSTRSSRRARRKIWGQLTPSAVLQNSREEKSTPSASEALVQEAQEGEETAGVVASLVNEGARRTLQLEQDGDACIADLHDTNNSRNGSATGVALPSLGKQESAVKVLTEIATIWLPALGTLLADPLTSLVDTACVGQVSAVQLAALGPNAAVFNMVFSMVSFVAVALANRIACNSLKAPDLSPQEMAGRRRENEETLSHTLIMATFFGCALAAGLFVFGRAILAAMGASTTFLTPALHYLYLRASGLPALLFMSAAQGACLGQQDMRTPMRAVLVAAGVNLVGDVLLINCLGLGTIGAGVATAVSHYAGALYFFRHLRSCGQDDSTVQLKWKGLPRFETVGPILAMGRFLVVRSLVLALTYDGMTTVATSMGDRVIAAHQVLLQCYLFAATAVEALSLTAQSLLARDQSDRHKSRRLAFVLLYFGAAVGTAVAAVFGLTLSSFPQMFTYDSSVIAMLRTSIPHGIACLILASISVTVEGICVGVGQFRHLPTIVFPSTGVTMACLVAAWKLRWGLSGVWVAMIMFFSARTLLHFIFILRKWQEMPFRAPDSLFTDDAAIPPQKLCNPASNDA